MGRHFIELCYVDHRLTKSLSVYLDLLTSIFYGRYLVTKSLIRTTSSVDPTGSEGVTDVVPFVPVETLNLH